MNEQALFPSYITREEERLIREQASLVHSDGQGRAVLLYGPGGVGKTQLVRHLALPSSDNPDIIWLDPIDIDDSEYWLLSNLERLVAGQLDPQNQYFGRYLDYLSRLPAYTRARVGHETVVSHLGRIKRVFAECYCDFIEASGKTVVIMFDTVEAIRGMYLLLTLAQWMKALPATLFVLSGRPPAGGDHKRDPIRNQLEDSYQNLPVTVISLGAFSQETAARYINGSGVAAGLTSDEKASLVLLTRGHPLWLAFAIAYLRDQGLPEEAAMPPAEIERHLPYHGDLSQAGYNLQEAFKRRLVAPYQDTDFWHEAVKRLAVLRESVNEPIWAELMRDRPRPDDAANMDEAWTKLLRTPWIRPRANRRYVTLHDAVAEELAQRIIPLHDEDRQWRLQLWRHAADLYGEHADRLEAELTVQLGELDAALQQWGSRSQPASQALSAEDEREFISSATRLDAERREFYQFKAIHLYYETLCDPAEGLRQFLVPFERAKYDHDILFQDLLAFEMQRFLPDRPDTRAPGDVVGEVIGEVRQWLSSAGQATYLEVGLSMVEYLIDDDQPETAVDLLSRLPTQHLGHVQRYRLSNLLGNACMRIPSQVRKALLHFQEALEHAERVQTADQARLIAKAHKELGYYYRNAGLWEQADEAYRQARDAISVTLSAQSSDDDREEMASIQTNWAYVKGLSGSHRDGTNLVESAIAVRHRLKRYQEEGISWSVCGEIYRYERRFEKAWQAYAEAEQIFQGQRNWSWLGLVYQEQAICLFQATQDRINLVPDRDPIEHAKRLITVALDLCSDLAVRGHPSALNRAGRIFGRDDVDAGLAYLAEGIDWARRLSDGWFWLANLVVYAELCYRAWAATGRQPYRDRIADRAAEIGEAMSEYEFPDLTGRWNLLQGHLQVHDYLDTGDQSRLGIALRHYNDGFAQVARGYVGSSGAAAVPGEFRTFAELIGRLPAEIRAQWQDELRRSWSRLAHGSTMLLARLEELY